MERISGQEQEIIYWRYARFMISSARFTSRKIIKPGQIGIE